MSLEILVVEDSVTQRRISCAALAAEGYVCREAATGSEALDAMGERLPDLVLLDIDLPDMTGYDVCQRIKGSRATRLIPVIMLTGHTRTEDLVYGLDAGAEDYLTKPFQVPELLARLRVAFRTKGLLEDLERLSVTDPLTGLRNRRYFDQRVLEEFARCVRYRNALACVLADLDHFKAINDTWGHDAGDEALVQVGRLMERHLRPCDLICRYGGEEFVLLLPDSHERGAYSCGERLRALCEQSSFGTQQNLKRITVSFGVAAFPGPDISTPADLTRRADEALYLAKQSGRNCVKAFSHVRGEEISDPNL